MIEKEVIKSLDVTVAGDSAGSPIDSSGLQPVGIKGPKISRRKKKKKEMESMGNILRTTDDNAHYHHLIMLEGDGRTLDTIPTEHRHHVHLIVEGNIMESDGHTHKLGSKDDAEESKINEIMEIMRYIEDVKKGVKEG